MEEKQREKQIYRVTIVGATVNLLLLLFKFFAGVVGRSSAMLADAIHSLSDFITDFVVLFFVRLSGKPKDCGHDYGHGKYETLGTLIVGLVLFAVGAGIFWNGMTLLFAFIRGETLPRPDRFALFAALVSIAVKEILYRYTVLVGKRCDSPVVIANAWHHRSDAFSSMGTALGISGAMFLGERWRVLDPLAAMIVSLFILKVAIRLVVPSLNDLLEHSLPDDVEQEILAVIAEDRRVKDPHGLRTRRIGNSIAIEIHIRVDGDLTVREAHLVASDVEKRLRTKYGATTHVAVHVEPEK